METARPNNCELQSFVCSRRLLLIVAFTFVPDALQRISLMLLVSALALLQQVRHIV